MTCDKFSDKKKYFLAHVIVDSEATCYSEVVTNLNRRDAMQQEIVGLEQNGNAGKRVLSSKWVYKIKYKANGSVERYKLHLVVLGNTHKKGVQILFESCYLLP